MPVIEKMLGKKALKTLSLVLDEVPGVGLVTGLGFGAWDMMHGHYKKAALDVISGLIADVPAVGPALGLAVGVGGTLLIDHYNKSKNNIIKKSMSNSSTIKSINTLNTLKAVNNKYSKSSLINNTINKQNNVFSTPNKIKKSQVNQPNNNLSASTNKIPKLQEREQTMNSIRSNVINLPAIHVTPDNTGQPVTSINNVVVPKNNAIHLSDVFPESYN